MPLQLVFSEWHHMVPKVVFLEFVEILLHCARCWYTSKQQKEHAIDHPALASTYVEVKLQTDLHFHHTHLCVLVPSLIIPPALYLQRTAINFAF